MKIKWPKFPDLPEIPKMPEMPDFEIPDEWCQLNRIANALEELVQIMKDKNGKL